MKRQQQKVDQIQIFWHGRKMFQIMYFLMLETFKTLKYAS